MGIRIICRPGPFGGVISGRLDGVVDASSETIAICESTKKGKELRQPDVPATRLWSYDLRQDRDERVSEWTASHVAAGYNPCPASQPGREMLAEQAVSPAPLTAAFRPAHRDILEGTTSSISSPPFFDSLYLYVWTTDRDASLAQGWRRLDDWPIRRKSDTSEAWSLRVDEYPQYAVVQFNHEVANQLRPPIDAPGGVLAPKGAHAVALLSTIRVRILSETAEHLSGLVTGLRYAYDHEDPYNPDSPPDDQAKLQIVVWAIDEDGSTALTTPCELSGYWMFDKVPHGWATAVQFAVAVTTRQFRPGHMIPALGGEVIAVDTFYRTLHRRAVSQPINPITK